MQLSETGATRDSLSEMFDTSNPRVLAAVHNAMRDRTGRLDRVNIQVIAAAAPLLDPNDVVQLLVHLPKTDLNIPVALPPREQLRRDLADVFLHVPRTIRTPLVKDLILRRTYRLLELSPFELLPPAAQSLVTKRLHQKARHARIGEVVEILAHPGCSIETIRQCFGAITAKEDWTNAATRSEQMTKFLRGFASIKRTGLDDIHRHLATDPEILVRAGVARSTQDLEIQWKFARDPNFHIREAVASASQDLEIQWKFARDPTPLVRAAVAETTQDLDIHRHLATDPDAFVRAAVAETTQDLDIHRHLATDPEILVRAGVARSTQDLEIHLRLDKESSKSIRIGLAKNAAVVDPMVIGRLAADVNCWVRHVFMLRVMATGSPELLRRYAPPDVKGFDIEVLLRCMLENLPLADVIELDDSLTNAVQDTVHAMGRGVKYVGARTRSITKWSQLPSRLDDPNQVDDRMQPFDGKCIQGIAGSIVRTGREILALQKRMGNCLDTYVDEARDGRITLVCYKDAARSNVYVAAVDVMGDTLELREINSIGNRRDLPNGFERAFKYELDAINESRLSMSIDAQFRRDHSCMGV